MIWIIAMAARSPEDNDDIHVHSDIIRADTFSQADEQGNKILALTFPPGRYAEQTLSVLPVVPQVFLAEITANAELAWKIFKKTLG